MKIALLTHDLKLGNAHLMPWRTLVEVAAGMQAMGHEVVLLSADTQPGPELTLDGVRVCPVEKPKAAPEALRARLLELAPDAVYWPFAWWGAGRDAGILRELPCRRIGYVPGARYRLSAVTRAAPALGLRHVLPYLLQALYPDRALARGLRACGIDDVITMSDDTERALVRGGWPVAHVHRVWPARDTRRGPEGPTPIYDRIRQEIGDGRFFLFFSPPTPIRGTETVLDAFEKLRDAHPDAHLVCLFRSDINVDMAAARARFDARRQGPRLHAVWKSVAPQELNAFLGSAHAVTLPFLLVPSEIPLAVIEAAGHGVPVITTGPSGTGDFVSAYGAQVRVADSADLAAAMTRMLRDEAFYARCRAAAQARFAACSDWAGVARDWLRVGVGDAA